MCSKRLTATLTTPPDHIAYALTQPLAIRTRTNVDSAGSGDVNAKPLMEQSFQIRGLKVGRGQYHLKYDLVSELQGEEYGECFTKE